MGPDFHEGGEEASFHQNPEELDDTSQYASIWRVKRRGSFPSPIQLKPTVISPFESVRMAMGLECKSESSEPNTRQQIQPYPRNLPRASTNLATAASFGVVAIETRCHTLGAV